MKLSRILEEVVAGVADSGEGARCVSGPPTGFGEPGYRKDDSALVA
jgi:hypothetical protein